VLCGEHPLLVRPLRRMAEVPASSDSGSTCTALVVGGNGYLGQFVVQGLLARGILVHATYHSREPPESLGKAAPCHQLDSSNEPQLRALITEIKPDVLVNCAAMSAVGRCEKDPAAAQRANCPFGLVSALGELQAPGLLVHCSTDLVFGGDADTLYTEDCAPLPVNEYGRVKAKFDQFLLGHTGEPRCVVLRLSNILGPRPPYGPAEGTKFLQWLDARLALDESSGIFEDEIRNYVWVRDLVDIVTKLVSDFVSGSFTMDAPRLFHCGGPNALSRADLAHVVAAARGHCLTFRVAEGAEQQKIKPTKRADVDLGYASPLCVRLQSSRVEALLGRPMQRIEDAVTAEAGSI